MMRIKPFIPVFLLLTVLLVLTAKGTPVDYSINIENGTHVVVSWTAVSGHDYQFYSSHSIGDGWLLRTSEYILEDGDQRFFYDSITNGSRFYRIEQLAQTSVSVEVAGISEQAWHGSNAWIPAGLSCNVSESCALISLGCWWDNEGQSPLPNDSNGAFTAAINENKTSPPVRVQVGYQLDAATGNHVVTPDHLGNDGDGWMVLLEVNGIESENALVDTGFSRDAHAYLNGNPDPNSIETITVTTDGSAAQVGDLAVAIYVMDPHSNPDIQSVAPPGWTELTRNDVAVDNVGYLTCYKIVDTAGEQSVTFNWTDNTTFVAEAGIAIFRAAPAN